MKSILSTLALLLSVVTAPAPSLTLGWNDTNPSWLPPVAGYYLMSSNALTVNIVFTPINIYTFSGTNMPPTNMITLFWVQTTNTAGFVSGWSSVLPWPYNPPKWVSPVYNSP